MADDLTAALDEIREHAHALSPLRLEGVHVELGKAVVLLNAAADVPRLLALADAVLKLAADWKQEAAGLDAEADGTSDDARGSHLLLRAQGCDDHSRALLEVISRALTGEDAS